MSAESVMSLVWDEVVDGLSEISAGATPSFDDGGGVYNETVNKVYKRLFMGNDWPPEQSAVGIWLKDWEEVPDDTNKTVFTLKILFWCGIYLTANSNENQTTGQSEASENGLKLQQDIARVCNNLRMSHVTGRNPVDFIIDGSIKFNNGLPFAKNRYETGFRLNVTAQWYGRSLLP